MSKITDHIIAFSELRQTRQELSAIHERHEDQIAKEKLATNKAREQHEHVLKDNRAKKLTLKNLRQELRTSQENHKGLESNLERLVQF